MNRLRNRHMRPIQALPLGFLAVILIGAFLLMLPVCSQSGTSLPFLDALFTATSATCVTGLVVVDTGTHFTMLGQTIILMLIQVGGLGFMTMAALVFLATGKRISLRERMTIAEAFSADQLRGVLRLVLFAVKMTLSIEFAGALLLSIRFIPDFGPVYGMWYSLFHAISAFCNAGFDLMGNFVSLTHYVGDPLVNIVIMLLIISGGLGFGAVAAVAQWHVVKKFSLHVRLALVATGIMIVSGFILFTTIEWSNPATLGALPSGQRLLAGMFQSVTTRTAGFNTIDQAGLYDVSKLLSVVFMSIGAAPAGTGGGMKVTTMALVLVQAFVVIRNREDVAFFHRRVPSSTIKRAQTVMLLYIAMILIMTVGVGVTEIGRAGGELSAVDQAFEVASAFGTVGLSSGFTAVASTFSRILLIMSMYMGRVGLLTMALALAGRKSAKQDMHYAESDVLIG